MRSILKYMVRRQDLYLQMQKKQETKKTGKLLDPTKGNMFTNRVIKVPSECTCTHLTQNDHNLLWCLVHAEKTTRSCWKYG